jgi:hypothetical protein
MGIFERMAKGWGFALESFHVLNEHKSLLLFPILSTISMLLVLATFVSGFYGISVAGVADLNNMDEATGYAVLFLFYVINSTVIIFFNMALIHCVFKVMDGQKPSLGSGIAFSLSRLHLVLCWALLTSTVGIVLKIVQDKSKFVGDMVAGLLGMAWSLATFFVVPVMAYENVGVGEAIKRSSSLFKSTWGERAGADFSFSLIGFCVFIGFAVLLFFVIQPFNWIAFLIPAIGFGVILSCVISAAETIFLARIYKTATSGSSAELKSLFS